MSKFWQKKYISKYTGAEIDAAVAKAGDAPQVVANPTLAGTEAALEGLQVGDTKYKVEAGGGLGFDLVVTITSTDPFTATFSETYQTIIGLLNAGKIVVGVADNNWAPIYKRSANSVECDMFRNIGPTTMSIIGYTLTSTDTTSIAEYEFTIST